MARPPARPLPYAPVWETEVLETVGRVIEHWGFKRNHGRLWALLYLVGEPMDAPALRRRLGLSKGAVSMVLRELESWSVVRRLPGTTRTAAYVAERDLWRMLRAVLRRREARLVQQARADLQLAEIELSRDDTLSPDERRVLAARVRTLRRFAEVATAALQAFLRSRRLNVDPLRRILTAGS